MNIVITGSSTGIGYSIAEHLLNRGDKVWGLARSAQTGLLEKYPHHFKALTCDVADWAQVQSAAAQIALDCGYLDGVIACAGIQGEIGPAMSADPLAWSQTVRVNLDGTYFTLRAFHALLAKAPNRSKVIAFSGGGATKPRKNFSAYGVAKTGILRLIETIAEELQGSAIDLNAVAPGAINTRLTDEVIALGPKVVGESEYQAALKQKANGGSSLAKAIGLVEWLLSAESDGISGRLISAPWDPWATLSKHREALSKSEIYTLRRIVPEDRGTAF
jgi:NAD(P)-dependent dehydrogenase (short-subunit alcohol dehydrogenase family)